MTNIKSRPFSGRAVTFRRLGFRKVENEMGVLLTELYQTNGGWVLGGRNCGSVFFTNASHVKHVFEKA